MAKNKGYAKLVGEQGICLVAMDIESLDDLEQGINYTATGDGVLLVDVDSLENATSEVAGRVLKILPKGFGGLVYITR